MFGFSSSEIIIIILFILFLYIYFIPSKIAFRKEKENRYVILLINTFFGGTGLGWLVALALALSGNEEKSKASRKMEKHKK